MQNLKSGLETIVWMIGLFSTKALYLGDKLEFNIANFCGNPFFGTLLEVRCT